jgi:hypothetical protein
LTFSMMTSWEVPQKLRAERHSDKTIDAFTSISP